MSAIMPVVATTFSEAACALAAKLRKNQNSHPLLTHCPYCFTLQFLLSRSVILMNQKRSGVAYLPQ